MFIELTMCSIIKLHKLGAFLQEICKTWLARHIAVPWHGEIAPIESSFDSVGPPIPN